MPWSKIFNHNPESLSHLRQLQTNFTHCTSNGAHDSQILRHRLPEAVADLQCLPEQRLGFLIAAPILPLVTPAVRAGVWVRKELTPPARPGSERWASLCSTTLLKTSRIIAPFGLKLGKGPPAACSSEAKLFIEVSVCGCSSPSLALPRCLVSYRCSGFQQAKVEDRAVEDLTPPVSRSTSSLLQSEELVSAEKRQVYRDTSQTCGVLAPTTQYTAALLP